MKTIQILFGCLMLVLNVLPASEALTDGSFEFRGIRMGSSMSDAGVMVKDSESPLNPPDVHTAHKKGDKLYIGGIRISEIVYFYFKDRLYRISIRWKGEYCEGVQPLKQAFEVKYNIKFGQSNKAKGRHIEYILNCSEPGKIYYSSPYGYLQITETDINDEVIDNFRKHQIIREKKEKEEKRIKAEGKVKESLDDL